MLGEVGLTQNFQLPQDLHHVWMRLIQSPLWKMQGTSEPQIPSLGRARVQYWNTNGEKELKKN